MAAKKTVSDRKREAVLKAAMQLFLRHGYSATTMDAVAKAAKVTKQTVYAHYTSKEQLFTHMLQHLCHRDTPMAASQSSLNAPFEQVLEKVGHTILDLITSPEGLGATRLVIAESARHPKLAELYYERGTKLLVQLMTQFLQSQSRREELAIRNYESAASYFIALLKGQVYVRMILGVTPIPSAKQKQAHVREVVAIFMHLYGRAHPLSTQSTL
jgi:TetR/AcrR family transcriptional regulator, mexJK operon transcriptional repressor